ncbi:4'-phosphopantetheinyl transferase family protein [Rheinheimera gaetbuli]
MIPSVRHNIFHDSELFTPTEAGPSFIERISRKHIEGFQGKCFECRFNQDLYSNQYNEQQFGIRLPAEMDNAVRKRRAEFVAGRVAASQALKALGAKIMHVGIGEHRQPLWPKPFIGSITHSVNKAICAVSRADSIQRIGIDIEPIIAASVAKNIFASVLLPCEYDMVGIPDNPDNKIFTLLFSAKESLFKALYPEVQKYFDFSAARCVELDIEASQFTLELTEALSPDLDAGSSFKGSFELDNHQVFTAITTKCVR